MSIEQLYTKGISNITRTESDVPRFTKICQKLHEHKLYTWDEIMPLVKNLTGFTKDSPVRRHIAVFKKLGIFDQRDATYILSSEGRVLLELTKDKAVEEGLALPEKIFYFRAFFSNALYQLFVFLEKIDQKQNLTNQKEVIADYFRTIVDSPFKIWQKESLRRDIEIYKSRGQLQSGLQNKFDCMKAWLRHLELLEDKGLVLTRLGGEVVKDLKSNDLYIGERIFSMTNIYLTGKIGSLPVFDYAQNTHRELFLELFELAYTLFETPQLGLSDAKSIRCFLCVKLLLDHQLTLEEKGFDDIVNKLARSHIIRSLMTGRDRKLAFISGFSRS